MPLSPQVHETFQLLNKSYHGNEPTQVMGTTLSLKFLVVVGKSNYNRAEPTMLQKDNWGKGRG